MQNYKNLYIIGTSHISKQSVKEVESTIITIKPKIVALELDKNRFQALLTKKQEKLKLKHLRTIGLKGFLFGIIAAYLQKKLGKIVGMKPGSEMKKAIILAKKMKIKLALIDQDIQITLKKLSKRITMKEKLRFLKEIILSPFSKEKIKIDLKKVPEKKLIKKLTSKLKKDYPSLYLTLVKERNIIMAKNLNKLMQDYKLVLAIVGAGHEEDIIKIIKYDIHKKRD